MKKLLSLIFSILILFGLSACDLSSFLPLGPDDPVDPVDPVDPIDPVDPVDPTEETSKVYFMSNNDVHGQLISDSSNGYMAMSEVEATVKYLEAKDSVKYIRGCSGDLLQGSYVSCVTEGKCMIDAANAAGFDYMVLGNHEFDWGIDTVLKYWDNDESNGEAKFPLLCANLRSTVTYSRPENVDAYTIINYGTLKVGIIGIIGDYQEKEIETTSLGNYEFTDSLTAIKSYALEIRSQVDVLVVAIHDYDEDLNQSIANLSKSYYIDAIICGHTHASIEDTITRGDGYKIPVIQSQTKSKNFHTIEISLDNKKVSSARTNYYNRNYYLTYVKTPDSAVKTVENSYSSVIESGNEVIYYANSYLSKQSLTDLMYEALKEKLYDLDGTDVEYIILNSGGIRTTLSKGYVTVADIYEVFPFNNYVSVLSINYDGIAQSYLSWQGGYGSYYFQTGAKSFSTSTYKLVVTVSYLSTKNYYQSYVYKDYKNLIYRDVLIEYLRANYAK